MPQPRLRDDSGQFTSWQKLYEVAKAGFGDIAPESVLVDEVAGILNNTPKIPNSECIASYQYFEKDQQLNLVFQARGTYTYFDFPADEYHNFDSAASKGTYFNLYIRDRYNFERIE